MSRRSRQNPESPWLWLCLGCGCELNESEFPKEGGKPATRCKKCRAVYLEAQKRVKAARAEELAEVEPDDGDWCDCGQAKESGAEACPRCLALDGETAQEADVIRALRHLGGSGTAEEIADETGASKRNTIRTCQAMVKAGKIDRIERTVDNELGWRLKRG